MPDLATLEDITQQPISKETVLNYELWALKRMGWKLGGIMHTFYNISKYFWLYNHFLEYIYDA